MPGSRQGTPSYQARAWLRVTAYVPCSISISVLLSDWGELGRSLMDMVAISDDNVDGWIRSVSTGDGK